jgi:hypothetical protein
MNTASQAAPALCSKQFIARPIVSVRKIVAAFTLAIGIAASVQAQIIASGEISGTPIGGGVYDYTISLHISPASSSGIQTFWYSWVPGLDFLPTAPLTVTAPPGWTAYIAGGPYYYPDGYSIEFLNFSTPLPPGSSLDFHFTSTDTPAELAGNSPIFPGYPIGTSFVYSGLVYGDELQFLIQSVPVPEPGVVGLLMAGSLGCWCVVRRLRIGR